MLSTQTRCLADAEYAHVQLLQVRTCYELLAHSNKLVTLDIRMPLNKAFYALVFNSASKYCLP